jgi:hypothetical protein
LADGIEFEPDGERVKTYSKLVAEPLEALGELVEPVVVYLRELRLKVADVKVGRLHLPSERLDALLVLCELRLQTVDRAALLAMRACVPPDIDTLGGAWRRRRAFSSGAHPSPHHAFVPYDTQSAMAVLSFARLAKYARQPRRDPIRQFENLPIGSADPWRWCHPYNVSTL